MNRYFRADNLQNFIALAGETRRIQLTFGKGKDMFSFHTYSTVPESLDLADKFINAGVKGRVSIHAMTDGFHVAHTIRESVCRD